MKLVFTRQIYFSDEDIIKVIEEGLKIAKREKWSFNRLVSESLKEFVERHKEGNVSFQLDKFGVTWNKAISVKEKEKKPHCSRCGAPAKRVYFLVNGGHVFACNRHKLGHQPNIRGFREI